MSWGYVAIAAAGAYSSYQSGEAADAQRDAANMSMEQKRRNYALIRKDTRMSRMSGVQAQIALNDMMGLESDNPYTQQIKDLQEQEFTNDPKPEKKDYWKRDIFGSSGSFHTTKQARDRYKADVQAWEARNQGNITDAEQRDAEIAKLRPKESAFGTREKYDFKGSPGYQFRLSEGEQALERSQAGRRLGGRSMKEAMRYGQGFATREYEAQFNRLSSIANRGQNAVGIAAGSQPNTLGESQMIGNAGVMEAEGKSDAVQGSLGNAGTLWESYNQPSTGTDYPQGSGPLVDRTYN